jgi:putative transposase
MDMGSSKFNEGQIISILRQADTGMPIKEFRRKQGFRVALFYKWRSKNCSMGISEAMRLRELELENGKVKRLLYGGASGHPSPQERIWRKNRHLSARPASQTLGRWAHGE